MEEYLYELLAVEFDQFECKTCIEAQIGLLRDSLIDKEVVEDELVREDL